MSAHIECPDCGYVLSDPEFETWNIREIATDSYGWVRCAAGLVCAECGEKI